MEIDIFRILVCRNSSDAAFVFGRHVLQFLFKRSELLSKYTLHGKIYYYNGSALIDWGSFINAVISFLVIAITLFVIVRIFTYLQQKRLLLAEKAKEEYYKKHPEERPVVAEPEPPKPTQEELLTDILVELKRANGTLVEEGTGGNDASKDPA